MEYLVIFLLLIGDEHERLKEAWSTIAGESIQDIRERALDGMAFEHRLLIERRPLGSLGLGHCARTSFCRMAYVEKEPRIRSDRDGDLVGEVLGLIEAYEAVDADILVGSGQRQERGMQGDGLSCQAFKPVLDGVAADADTATDSAQALAPDMPREEVVVRNHSLCIIIKRKCLRGEAFATNATAKARYYSEGFGVMTSC